MKVLHICGNDVLEPTGGLGVAVDEITRAQSAIGMDVAVLYFNELKPTFHRQTHEGRDLIRADVTVAGQLHGDLQYHRRIHRGLTTTLCYALGKSEFDIIHLHDTVPYPAAELARALFKCPVVMTSHLSFALENAESAPLTADVNTDFQEELTAVAECYVSTVSGEYANAMLDYFFLDKPVFVVPNGINIKPIDEEPLVDIGSITKGKKAVYFCGRIVPGKGIDLVMEAAKALPEYHFILFAMTAAHCANVTDLEIKLETYADFLDNITWFRNFPIRKQFGYLKACDMALVPSLNKAPFEITGLEAMAAKVPLITTATCGMKEYCNSTNSDIHEPALEALIAAIQNHSRDESKIASARATAESFTWQRAAAGYAKLYQGVIHDFMAIRRAA